METKPSAQSLFKKFDIGNSNQKSGKNGYQTLLFLSNIAGFLYFVPNILSGIVGGCKNKQMSEYWEINKLICCIEENVPNFKNAVVSLVVLYLSAGSDLT